MQAKTVYAETAQVSRYVMWRLVPTLTFSVGQLASRPIDVNANEASAATSHPAPRRPPDQKQLTGSMRFSIAAEPHS